MSELINKYISVKTRSNSNLQSQYCKERKPSISKHIIYKIKEYYNEYNVITIIF